MLLVFAVFAFLSAALLLFWLSKRQIAKGLDRNSFSLEPPTVRSLFEPSEQDLKHDLEISEAREIARREYVATAQSRAMVDRSLLEWRENPNRKNTAELLRVAAERGLESDFARAGTEIIELFRRSGIEGLKSNDLAALLDSHIHLLSETERGSGAMFWLKQETAELASADDLDN